MSILTLIEEMGWISKRTASSNGGEYHSPCPNCAGGTDRLCIWPTQGKGGRYWCRQCGCKGDAIQFCRDYLGLSFKDACMRVGQNHVFQNRVYQPHSNSFLPKEAVPPPIKWQQEAFRFVKLCHSHIFNDPSAISDLSDRGITGDSIENFVLGWNPCSRWDSKNQWGIADEGGGFLRVG